MTSDPARANGVVLILLLNHESSISHCALALGLPQVRQFNQSQKIPKHSSDTTVPYIPGPSPHL